jgi:hypothetical protein
MSSTPLAWVLLACRPHPTVPPPAGQTTTPPTLVETGDSGLPVGSELTWIEPSVQIRGQAGQEIHRELSLLPAYGGQPGTLFVRSGSQPEPYPQTFAGYPRSFTVPGAIPRGEHTITDLWDGGVSFSSAFVAAGDVDHDGHMDMWSYEGMLYLGPFVGEGVEWADAHADLDGFWTAAFGNFDADGDGEFDLVATADQFAYIYHGPFEGTVPGWTENPEISILGDENCPLASGAQRLHDYFSPGVDAVAVGRGAGFWCTPDVLVYPLHGSRGRRIDFSGALSEIETSAATPSTLQSAGDLDGDGDAEVAQGTSDLRRIYQNPLTPSFFDTPLAWDLGTNAAVTAAVGDVNGDGGTDLVAWIGLEDPYGPEGVWIGLLLTPLDVTRSAEEQAVPLTPGCVSTAERLCFNYAGTIASDLDGDGLSDLLDVQEGPDDAGYITIWYASDINAALAARRNR